MNIEEQVQLTTEASNEPTRIGCVYTRRPDHDRRQSVDAVVNVISTRLSPIDFQTDQ